jgi:poly-gamma-glutamate capsule biosynthesis protein CapA/YwtB (metallophosphatase superfamily)
MKSSAQEVVLLALGDIYINRDNPGEAFQHVLPLMKDKGVLFGNLETTLSDAQIPPMPGRGSPMKASQRMIEGIVEADFDLVSLANNHTTDYGTKGLVQTIELLDRKGIQHVGAGKNIHEALEPAIITRNGLKIGFLAYEATVWSFGGDAKESKPGVAKIHVNSLLPPPNIAREDLARMAQHIKEVKSCVDILIASFHWGAELTTTLTPHQQSIAYTAVDSGADIIIGHHPHILQGVEVYMGRPIFYSLGDFIFDEEFFYPDDTIIVKARISNKEMKVALIPVFLNEEGNPESLDQSMLKHKGILAKMAALCKELGSELDENTGELIT